jgi:hypothetical protein
MIEAITGFGGLLSMRKTADGSDHPYEMNIALFDAMRGTLDGPDEHQIVRFVCSQTVMMSLQGIPAFYIHSLLASPNDTDGVKRTSHNRTINRSQLDYGELEAALGDETSTRHQVFHRLKQLIAIRSRQPAFHPNALQSVLQLGSGVFGVERVSLDQSQTILAIANMQPVAAVLNTVSLDLAPGSTWCDLISGRAMQQRPARTASCAIPVHLAVEYDRLTSAASGVVGGYGLQDLVHDVRVCRCNPRPGRHEGRLHRVLQKSLTCLDQVAGEQLDRLFFPVPVDVQAHSCLASL